MKIKYSLQSFELGFYIANKIYENALTLFLIFLFIKKIIDINISTSLTHLSTVYE